MNKQTNGQLRGTTANRTTTRNSRGSSLSAAAWLLLASPAGALAQTFDIGAYAHDRDLPSRTADRILHGGSVSQFSDYVSPSGSAYGSGSASAMATGAVGVLKARATAEATAPTQPFATTEAFGDGDAWVYYRDTLTIHSPGREGRPGSAVVSLRLPGAAMTFGIDHPNKAGVASAGGSVNFQVGLNSDGYMFEGGIGATGALGSIPSHLELPFDFAFGVPFGISLYLAIQASASATSRWDGPPVPSGLVNHAFVDLDFGHSVYWDGLSGIASNGTPLEAGAYTANGADGVDYLQSFVPVPEPEHYALLGGLGLVGFTFWRRRANSAGAGAPRVPAASLEVQPNTRMTIFVHRQCAAWCRR